jgi:hypothetical protein
MSFDLPDYVIYQGRWYAEDEDTPNYIRWGPWKNVSEWEYLELLDHIKKGAKYQVRILKQIHIEGFGVTDDMEQNPGLWVNPGLGD